MKNNGVILMKVSVKGEDSEKRADVSPVPSPVIPETYDEAMELTGHGFYNYVLLLACSIISIAVALDLFGFSIVVVASSCDLRLTMEQKGLLSSIPFAGIFFAFPWGYFADTAGRRRALMWSTSVGFIFAALSSLSSEWYYMVALKFLGCKADRNTDRSRMSLQEENAVGVPSTCHRKAINAKGSSAAFSITMTFLGECTGSKHRSQYLQIMNSVNLSTEAVSFLLALFILPLPFSPRVPWLGITYRPWRLLTFIMSVPLGLGTLLLLYLHESPKFLASKGREGKALEVLEDIFVKNGGVRGEFPIVRRTPILIVEETQPSISPSPKPVPGPSIGPDEGIVVDSVVEAVIVPAAELIIAKKETERRFNLWVKTKKRLSRSSKSPRPKPIKVLVINKKTTSKTFWKAILEQTAPIFKPPLLLRTVQMFYLLLIICSTNNVFVMWFPSMVNSLFISLADEAAGGGKSFCERLNDNATSKDHFEHNHLVCNDVISNDTIYSGIGYGVFFLVVNLVVSKLSQFRRVVLLTTFVVSAISCLLVDLIRQPVANLIFFILLQSTSICLGIAASYFIDFFPTSYRALATSLGMMIGRIGTFVGVNIVGLVITNYCSITFYSWTIFVLSGVIVALFLPSDRKLKSLS